MRKQLFISSLLLCVLSITCSADNYVIINQVMYDTPLNELVTQPPYSNGEFVELYNGSNESVNLQGWYISGDGSTEQFYFQNISIPSKGFLAVAFLHPNSPSFRLEDLFNLPSGNTPFQIIYQYSIILANQGETITLYNADNEIVDQIYYDGTSNKTKPDRLSAENEDNTPGSQCVSLYRTWVEFDENGLVVPGTSQWKTGLVSLGNCQLADTSFGEHSLTGTQPLPDGENYIIYVSPLDPTTRVTITDDGVSVSNGVRTQTAIQYYDGLGRPNERIAIEASPSKWDLVQVTNYSGLNREDQKWLPIPQQTEGQYMDTSSVKSQTQSYYSDTRPFTETIYENSALNRVTGNKREGDTWDSHPSSNTYSCNSGTDNVRIYTVSGNDKLKTTGDVYGPCTLYKTTLSDEDGKSVTTYTDKLGHTIMEERAGNRTYYVYDRLERLRFVLPHIPSSKLNNGEYDLTDTTLQAAAYCYRYDDRGNMIFKRLPGCAPQYMVYDQLGQLVLKQDSKQRAENKWTLCAYDSIGRNLYTAEIKQTQTHEYYVDFFADKWAVEHYGNNPANKSIPGTGYASTILGKNNLRLLTVNYYDNYDYISQREPTNIRPKLRFSQESGYGLQHNNATGLLTGTRIYNLSEDGYTAYSYYYDAKGRVVQNRSVRNNDGYKNSTSTEYLFDGSVAQQLTEQGTDADVVKEHYRYTYDHVGRLLNTFYQLNNDEEITLSSFSYDETGRMAQNLFHNSIDATRYFYDIRNMLTESQNTHFSERLFYADNPSATPCYNGNISAARIAQKDTAFNFYYTYDALNRLTETEQDDRNGQKAPSEWFEYDSRGNITRLQRYTGPRLLDDLTFRYQPDGNQLLAVKEEGLDADRYGMVEYHDRHLDPFDDGLDDMGYDANGNLIYDADREISIIKYNILNLPDTIQFHSGHQIVNLYDAAGRKYKSVIYTNTATAGTQYDEIAHYEFDMDTVVWRVTEYNNNMELVYTREDTITRRIHNSIGYNADGRYYHYIKDHLGNICAVVNSETNTPVQRTTYYASGVPMAENLGPDVPPSLYYAMGVQYTENFGRDEQPYLYNGKEFVEAHGLNEYDSQARMYYAPIMRTITMDLFAENYYHISPYAWCGNNPIAFVDPDGKDWYSTYDENGDRVFLYNSDVHSQEDLDKAKIKGTYEGATKEYNGVYYSLFGHQMPSNSYEGQIYKILDDALIRKAAYEKEEAYLATHPSAFSSEVNLSPQITFQVNGVNIGTPYRVEYEGGQGVFYPVEKNRGRMVNWPGDSNMPMIISGYLSGDNKPAYHLRYMNDTRMDLIHIKFDKKNAQEFLQKYQRQFYPH